MLCVSNLITKYFGDCSIDICLFVLYCVVCYVIFLTSFLPDCCMTVFVDLRNDVYVCMYRLWDSE